MAHAIRIADANGTIALTGWVDYVPSSPDLTPIEYDPGGLRDGGEITSTTRRNVTETCQCWVESTTGTAIAGSVNTIERYLVQAEHYQRTRLGNPVYVEFQQDGAASSYRSEILNGRVEWDKDALEVAQTVGRRMLAGITWTRRYYWEGAEVELPMTTASLITNPTFDSGTTGWTAAFGTISSVAGGYSGNCLKVTSGTIGYGQARQTFPTVVGETYSVALWAKNGDATSHLKMGTTAGGSDLVDAYYNESAWARKTASFVATAGTTHIRLGVESATANKYVYFDEISCTLSARSPGTVYNGVLAVGTANYVDIAGTAITGVIPSQPRVVVTYTPDGVGLKNLHVGQSTFSGTSDWSHNFEGEVATGGTAVAQADGTGGSAGYHHIPTSSTDLFSWTFTPRALTAADGGWFRIVARVMDESPEDCYLKASLKLSTSTIWSGQETLAGTARPEYTDLGVVQLPPWDCGGGSIYPLTLAISGYSANGGTAVKAYIDYVQLLPLDGWASYRSFQPSINGSGALTDDLSHGVLYADMGGTARMCIHKRIGNGVTLWPDHNTRLYVLTENSNDKLDKTDYVSVRVYHRPRRLTL